MKRNKLYEGAINRFGSVSQIHMLLEEMSELAKAVLKDLRYSEQRKKDVIDEIVDVEIMLEQTKIVYQITPEEFAERKRFKKRRIEKMIQPHPSVRQLIETIQKQYKKRIIGNEIRLTLVESDTGIPIAEQYNQHIEGVIEYGAIVRWHEINRDCDNDNTGKVAITMGIFRNE